LAISLYLSQNKQIYASLLSKVLKKDVIELKNYFKELGCSFEVKKNDETKE